MIRLKASLMVAWQACGRDVRRGKEEGAAGGRHGGRAAGGGAWGRCRAAPACSLLCFLFSVKADVRGSLLCVRGRKQEEGEEEKRRKEKEEKERKKKKKRKKIQT
jgi:hypothetical protein